MRIAIIDTSSTRAAIISDGLREAGLNDLIVIDPRDRRSEAASLLRLAGLKRQFAAIEAKHDLWALLRRSLLD